MLLGVSFMPVGVGLVGEKVIGGGGGLREKFVQGLPCLEEIFPMEMLLGGSLGACLLGFCVGVVFGGWEDFRSKFGQGFPCLEAFSV